MKQYKLNDIAPVVQGTVSKSDKYWLLNLDMVESNTGRILGYKYVAPDQIGSSTVSFDTGNVLYSKLRPYLNKVILPQQDGYATSEMVPLRPNTSIISREYLAYYLRSPMFVNFINSKTSGAKMPRANITELKQHVINCPSIDKQNQITAQLDEITVSQEICIRCFKKLDDLVKTRFIELFGDPVTNSQNRIIRPFREFMKNIRYGTSQPPVFSDDGRYKFIRATNIKSGRITEQDMLRITEEEAKKIEKCKLLGNEIIIVRSGANTGDTCVVTPEYSGQYAGYDIIISLDMDKATPVFFNELMNTNYMQAVIKPLTIRAAQPHINSEQVQNLPMLDVPLEEQLKFTAFVSEIDSSRDCLQKTLIQLNNLKTSLMQEYFG